jgi:hypothetical protein
MSVATQSYRQRCRLLRGLAVVLISASLLSACTPKIDLNVDRQQVDAAIAAIQKQSDLWREQVADLAKKFRESAFELEHQVAVDLTDLASNSLNTAAVIGACTTEYVAGHVVSVLESISAKYFRGPPPPPPQPSVCDPVPLQVQQASVLNGNTALAFYGYYLNSYPLYALVRDQSGTLSQPVAIDVASPYIVVANLGPSGQVQISPTTSAILLMAKYPGPNGEDTQLSDVSVAPVTRDEVDNVVLSVTPKPPLPNTPTLLIDGLNISIPGILDPTFQQFISASPTILVAKQIKRSDLSGRAIQVCYWPGVNIYRRGDADHVNVHVSLLGDLPDGTQYRFAQDGTVPVPVPGTNPASCYNSRPTLP